MPDPHLRTIYKGQDRMVEEKEKEGVVGPWTGEEVGELSREDDRRRGKLVF